MLGALLNHLKTHPKEFSIRADNLIMEDKKESFMEIIFHGQQDWQKTQECLLGVIQMLHDQYQIAQLREIHLSLTLMDEEGFDVELRDTETEEAYRIMEVFRNDNEYHHIRQTHPLTLVVDNTKEND